MTDDRLTDAGNERLDELAPNSDPLSYRLLDAARYYTLMLVQLFQTIAALAMVGSGILFLAMQSDRFIGPLAMNGVVFLVAYVVNDTLQHGWWWADE